MLSTFLFKEYQLKSQCMYKTPQNILCLIKSQILGKILCPIKLNTKRIPKNSYSHQGFTLFNINNWPFL